jgi:hypothetical protein
MAEGYLTEFEILTSYRIALVQYNQSSFCLFISRSYPFFRLMQLVVQTEYRKGLRTNE